MPAVSSDSLDDLVSRAQALAPMLRDAAEEIDEARQLPAAIVESLKDAGCFRMSLPKDWGGLEADPLTQNLVIEAIAAASGSAGWCVMIGAANNYFPAFLEQTVAREMFPHANLVIAGALKPPARADVVPGGYRVSGRLPFASGVTHADWVAFGATAFENGVPIPGPGGVPKEFWALAPIADVQVLDTWYSGGLKGTGSNDIAVEDVFVPAERTFTLSGPSPYRKEPLYQYGQMFLTNHPGVPLGIGRGAIEEFIRIIRDKPGKFGVAPRDQAATQGALATAVIQVDSARAFVFTVLGRFWASLVDGRYPDPADRIRLRLAITHAHDACARAVQQLYHAAGSASIYVPNVLDRCFRDIHAADQHVVASGMLYDVGARALLTGNLPPGW